MAVSEPAMAVTVLASIQLYLGLVFTHAAFYKFRDLAAFTAGIRHYRLVSSASAGRLARVLPCAELGAGIGLLTSVATQASASVVASLLLVYSAAIIINLRRGRVIPCGCHGLAGPDTIRPASVVRNGILLAGALMVVASPWSNAGHVQLLGALRRLDPSAALEGAFAIMALTGFLAVLLPLTEWTLALRGRRARLRAGGRT